MSDWYDHPEYFDLVFRDETEMEVEFFADAFERFCDAPVRRLLEPGCGSGRLVAALAERGFDVTGVDLSVPMLDYLRNRLDKNRLNATVVHGDMTEMRLGQTFDAAYCTFNTFRHLLTENDAVSHLRSVATHLRPGGLYILGFHIIPLDADEDCTERWRATEDGLSVHVTLKVVRFERRKRLERLRVIIKATRDNGEIDRVRHEFPLRLYTQRQVASLLRKVNDVFEIVDTFDFDYDIESPRAFDDDLTDALLVLRRI